MPKGFVPNQSTRDYTCKICGVVSKGWGAHQTHLGHVHDKGSASASSRKKAAASRRKNNGKVKHTSVLRKRIVKQIVEGSKLKGASYDQSVPWNLGLVDALNMARKSIERSLEIIEGSKAL